jgi:cobalamin-dependent methionine synthase I
VNPALIHSVPYSIRVQAEGEGGPYLCLSDYVAPPGHRDHVGQFAVSCVGAEQLCAEYEQQLDDYGIIMVKALADRLAEVITRGFSEYQYFMSSPLNTNLLTPMLSEWELARVYFKGTSL